MRHRLALFLSLVFFPWLYAEVYGQTTENELKKLDSLAYLKPDSVLTLLNGMTFKSERSNEFILYAKIKASAYSYLGESDSSLYYYNKLIDNKIKIKDLTILADAYNGISDHYQKKGSLDSALLFCNTALGIGHELKNSSVISTSLNNIGLTYLYKAEYDSAIRYLEEGYQMLASLKDTVKMAMVLNNLFYCKYKINNIEEAAQTLLLSLELKKNSKTSSSYIKGLSNLVVLYTRLNKIDEAEILLHELLALTEDSNMLPTRGQAISNLAFIYSTKEKKDSALIYYQQAYSVFDEIGDLAKQGKALRNMGAIYEDVGNYSKALECSKKSLDIFQRIGNNEELFTANINIGSIFMTMEEPTQARSFLLEAERLGKQLNNAAHNMQTNSKLSRYYAMIGKYKQAYNYYFEFKALSDSVYSIETESSIRDIEAKYQNKEKQAEINQLEANAKIRELEIREKERELRNQRIVLMAVILIVLLIAFVGYLLFQRYKLKQKNARTELDKRRIEIEHRMIRSQMNPHFIFNSLNSVQSLIFQERNEDARIYLNKFARLLRLILENSRHQYVPLSSEIESLRNYIEIEQLRFKDKFDYEIEDLTDDADFIGIPPMLIQPFVENSILHGIKNKVGKGHIKLTYSISDDDILTCTVLDDGIGRKAAIKSNLESETNKHNSLATTLIEQRVELFKKKQGADITLVIKDIEEKERTGTLVEIKIPSKNI